MCVFLNNRFDHKSVGNDTVRNCSGFLHSDLLCFDEMVADLAADAKNCDELEPERE